MSSTNKTTHYELSQFLGTDKPAWLGDYNADMSKIDTAVYSASSTATSADGKADTNTTAIGTLASLTTESKTNLVSAINEVDSHADTAQGTANDAATAANGAVLAINSLKDYLNLGATNKDLTSSDMSKNGIGNIGSASNLHIVGNTDNSLVKIYGEVYLTDGTPNSPVDITVSNTGITPDSNITVNSCGYITYASGNNVVAVDPLQYTINSNGTITFTITPYIGNSGAAKFMACLVFVKNFGDA